MSVPFSKVTLYKVPALSPTYRDTYNFSNETAQKNFFLNHSPKILSPSQITRITNNQIKVPYPADVVREYNYMSIQNQRRDDTTGTGASDRIYYCFITNAEYVSDLCTLITFAVDVIQTFYLEAEFGSSFVERTHTNTDGLFANRVPEPFGGTDYTADTQYIVPITPYVVIGIADGTEIPQQVVGETRHTCRGGFYLDRRIYMASEFFIYNLDDSNDVTALVAIVDDLVSQGKVEAITDFYVVPSTASSQSTTGAKIGALTTGGQRSFTIPSSAGITPTSGTYISGYLPQNKKLYNSPFTKLRVTAPNGQRMELKFEEATAGAGTLPSFRERGSWVGGGETILQATNYGTGTGVTTSFEYCLTLNEFPHCSFNADSYKTWQAQKAGAEVTSMATNVLANLITTALLALASGYTGGATTGATIASAATTASAIKTGAQFVKDMGDIVADSIEASKKPNPVYNTNIAGGMYLSHNFLGWIFERVSISKPEAEQIDNYFTMFGYANNKIMNVKSHIMNSTRPKFCYIKTKGMSVQGNFPSEYKTVINDIFDNGITFWKPNATVGDYSNNNV